MIQKPEYLSRTTERLLDELMEEELYTRAIRYIGLFLITLGVCYYMLLTAITPHLAQWLARPPNPNFFAIEFWNAYNLLWFGLAPFLILSGLVLLVRRNPVMVHLLSRDDIVGLSAYKMLKDKLWVVGVLFIFITLASLYALIYL